MKVSAALPTGVAALLFDSARRRRQLEDELVARLGGGGFSEVILPVVDYLDPYEELLGETSRRELYRFVDRDGEVLALRADFTPMLARLLAPRLASLELPLKLFYRGDVVRYEEEHAGRQREFYQLGAEVLGLPGEEGEALVLRQFLELLAAGAGRVLVVAGFAGALDRLLRNAGPRRSADPHALAAAVVRRERRVGEPGSVLRQVVERGVPDDPRRLGPAAAARLDRLAARCAELGREFPRIDLRLDLAEFADQIVDPELLAADDRGATEDGSPELEAPDRVYYDGLVFRAYAVRRGAAPLRVGGGGRYDRLFHRLGARVTAAGFALSLDRLAGRGEEAGE